MTLHVQKPETLAKLREIADADATSLDQALEAAVEEALARRHARFLAEEAKRSTPEEKLRRIREISARVSALPRTGLKADKAFFDEMSGDED